MGIIPKIPKLTLVMEAVSTVANPTNITKLKDGHLKFDACLQSINTINRNTNNYPEDVLFEAANSQRIKELVLRRAWFGELTHPYEKKDFHRCMEIVPKNISHRIAEMLKKQGNLCLSNIETVEPMGKTLVNWIEGGTQIGFSMRGLTPYKFTKETPYKHSIIKSPMNILTYDAVFYPSHPEALMLGKMTNESTELITDMESVIDFITEESAIYKIFKNELGIEIDKTKPIHRVKEESAIDIALKNGQLARMDLEVNILKEISNSIKF